MSKTPEEWKEDCPDEWECQYRFYKTVVRDGETYHLWECHIVRDEGFYDEDGLPDIRTNQVYCALEHIYDADNELVGEGFPDDLSEG